MIRLRDILNEVFQKMVWVYHATTPKNLVSIAQIGLKVNCRFNRKKWGDADWSYDCKGKIFVSTNFEEASFYGNAGIWDTKNKKGLIGPVLRFKYDINSLTKDPNGNYGEEYFTEIPIKTNFEIFIPDRPNQDYFYKHKKYKLSETVIFPTNNKNRSLEMINGQYWLMLRDKNNYTENNIKLTKIDDKFYNIYGDELIIHNNGEDFSFKEKNNTDDGKGIWYDTKRGKWKTLTIQLANDIASGKLERNKI